MCVGYRGAGVGKGQQVLLQGGCSGLHCVNSSSNVPQQSRPSADYCCNPVHSVRAQTGEDELLTIHSPTKGPTTIGPASRNGPKVGLRLTAGREGIARAEAHPSTAMRRRDSQTRPRWLATAALRGRWRGRNAQQPPPSSLCVKERGWAGPCSPSQELSIRYMTRNRSEPVDPAAQNHGPHSSHRHRRPSPSATVGGKNFETDNWQRAAGKRLNLLPPKPVPCPI